MIRNEEAPPLPKRQLRVAYKSQEDYLAEQFYLFVEDFLGPLRQGIKEFMANTSNSLENGNEKFRPKSIRIYEGVHILERKCVLDSGIVVEIKFDTKKHKLVKWDFCSFLKYGNIVCLTYDNCDTLLYALIAERKTKNLKEGKISLNIIGKKFSAFEEMKAAANGRIVMLESTSFYTAYRHTITSMKSMAERMLRREREVIPFSKYIVDLKTRIAEPRYSILSNGDFDCLVRDKAMKHNYSRVPLLKTKHWPKAEELGMDGDQHRALRLCLTKELGILQGPPGTGKTWMGLKIVEFMINNRLGCSERGRNPILLLSYTNHALDQFFNALFDIESLQKLLHRSEPPFVRIGSQSNIERIKAVSLTEIRKKQRHSNSKAHRKNIFDLKQKLHENELWKEKTKSSVISPDHLYSKGCISKEHIDSLKQQGADYKKIIFEWLELKNPTFSDSVLTTNFTVNQNNQITLDADDEEDFKSQLVERIVDYADDLHFDEKKFLRGVLSNLVVSEELLVPKKESFLHPFWKALSLKNREKILKYVSMRFRLYGEMMEKEVNKVKNVWELSIDDRWRLYKFWRGKFQELLRQEEITLMQEFEEKNKIYLKEKKIDDIKIVSNCFLVGMTTTGAGMNILQEVLPRIVIVEEAAQVMEQHILGCLTKNVEHLILIGDHQQLRPAVHNYELSKTHKTDVSLMERLVLNRMPYECLSQQHRMRPEISAMLTPTIYKTLRNHPSVLDYERIRGIKNDIFFFCHTNRESQSENSTSHKNAFEAEMIARLCLYLFLQGYSKKGITILSTYKDQVKVIRHCIKSAEDKISHKIYDNKGKISVTTVDNFQGEENEIILLSLVRSNEEMKIGHLKDTKRICVALSRAKNCLFVFGNFQSIQKNETWKKIVFKAKDDGNYGNSILLKCVNHPNKTTEVSKPEDFDMIPFGGCGKPCGYRRECGHICDLTCHAIAAYHERPCEVLVRKVHPRCKHELRLRCSTRLRTPLGYISCRVCEKDSGLPSSSEAQPDQDRDPMSSPW
ncbi:NFX1-type zinc finger-containing protein 1-like [Saccostrea cucullata]|uniref:NFX1-type zinc finger-containing protein 1-like n=1 Tax=Saccostrea cuccullata TaxID=36930 RepID=UPI002ED64F2E